MSRRGTSSGGGASSLGYLFGSDATSLARPNNRAPPRPQPPPPDHMSSGAENAVMQHSGYHPPRSRQQQDEPGDQPTGYDTPTAYHTGPEYGASSVESSNCRPSPMRLQTRAAGKVVNDGGGVSLDMSGGSLGRNNNYFRADGQNSGNFITDRPSTRVQAAPGGSSSLGYLFGGA